MGRIGPMAVEDVNGFLVSELAMSGIDFAAVGAAISIQQVLELVGFEPCERRGPQF